MFGFRNKEAKAKIDDFKENLKYCDSLKEEIETQIDINRSLEAEKVEEAKTTLALFDGLKNEILSLKNNPHLKPKEKIIAISNKKLDVDKARLELEKINKLLEEN